MMWRLRRVKLGMSTLEEFTMSPTRIARVDLNGGRFRRVIHPKMHLLGKDIDQTLINQFQEGSDPEKLGLGPY